MLNLTKTIKGALIGLLVGVFFLGYVFIIGLGLYYWTVYSYENNFSYLLMVSPVIATILVVCSVVGAIVTIKKRHLC